MGVLRVMSRRGDDVVTWEYPALNEREPEMPAALHEAARTFEAQKAQGAMAFKVKPGAAPVRIDHFDAEAEEIVLVPRVVGGSR